MTSRERAEGPGVSSARTRDPLGFPFLPALSACYLAARTLRKRLAVSLAGRGTAVAGDYPGSMTY